LLLFIRKNLILADCFCEQQICSTDYSPPPPPPSPSKLNNEKQHEPVYQIATRHLQQAMVPGSHLVSVHLCDRMAYERAIQYATDRSSDIS
jgi:hypothetical protein